ncbi:F510_1955 family glycosylhydrolase [Sinomonas halotolerans]|uniref:F510_1955 family glycosylhydrolase n=1 Tax=Sinomonas halotolerans TaxID=1644133 RepID=A0ABU9X318_9MICC
MSRRRAAGAALALAAALAVTGCSAGGNGAGGNSADGASTGGHSAGTGGPAAPGNAASAIPGGHVHGLAASADGERLLVATHEGVFDASSGAPELISDPDDFMGFVGDPDGTLWASGHPGHGSDRPNPVGLVRSEDGGRTWTTASSEGVSDFHSLAVTEAGLVGFDGRLLRTPTGESWTEVDADVRPAMLGGHPSTKTVLATTEKGLFTSPDGGARWFAVPSAPLLQFAALADAERAVGVTPDGVVYSSADAGVSWTRVGELGSRATALTAAAEPGGPVRVWAATLDGLVESADGGATFAPLGG